ncbi:unnamed protein product [Brassica oleracea var. botrytis]
MSQVVIDLKECIASENSMKIKSNEIDSHDSLELSSSLEDEVVPSASGFDSKKDPQREKASHASLSPPGPPNYLSPPCSSAAKITLPISK